jgi:hypothetical protein
MPIRSLTVLWLNQLDTFVNSFPSSKDVFKPPVFPGTDKAKKWYESFEDWVSKSIGPSGVPLSYVLRENKVATNPEEFAIFQPNMDKDLARMCRHDTPNSIFWVGDNTMVWNQLRECFHPTKDYTWVNPFEKSKDGHGTYWAAKKHALGPGAVRTISASVDKIIATTHYDSKNKSWTFDMVVTRLNEAFHNSALEQNDTQKVINLLDFITDTSSFPVKLSIIANNQLRASSIIDFSNARNL